MPNVIDKVIEGVTPAYTQEEIGTIRAFVVSLVAALEEPYEWSHDDPGYSLLVSPSRSPVRALPWLAQFVGIQFSGEISPNEAARRAIIVDRPLWRRGRFDHIVAVTQATLVGTRQVSISERWNDNAYRLRVQVEVLETPDRAETRAAIEAVLPAGIILTFVVEGVILSWGSLLANEMTWGNVKNSFATWQDVKNNIQI